MNVKRITNIFMILCLIVVMSAGMVAAEERYAFSASNPGGTWYTMSGGVVKLLNEKLPKDIRIDMIASGGSVLNARRMAGGEADITLSYSSHLWDSWNGKGIMEGRPSDNARILFEIYRSSHYFVTLANKGIKTMQDLEGRKVVLGSPGSGSSDNSRRTFKALDIDVDSVELAFGDAARALQDGKVDAMGMSGAPASGIVELAASKEIFIIPFSDEELDKIVQATPFFSKGVMPANTYEDQPNDVPCFSFSVYLVANKSVPEDVVYKVMNIIFSEEGKDYLADVHPQWKRMGNNPEAVAQVGIPYHPGAERFWNEQ